MSHLNLADENKNIEVNLSFSSHTTPGTCLLNSVVGVTLDSIPLYLQASWRSDVHLHQCFLSIPALSLNHIILYYPQASENATGWENLKHRAKKKKKGLISPCKSPGASCVSVSRKPQLTDVSSDGIFA